MIQTSQQIHKAVQSVTAGWQSNRPARVVAPATAILWDDGERFAADVAVAGEAPTRSILTSTRPIDTGWLQQKSPGCRSAVAIPSR